MNEEDKKAIKELKHYINITEYWKQEEYTNIEIDNYIKIVLNLIDKQQKEIDFLQTKIKQNENIEKVKMCMTHNLPNNAEIVCMIREDFERNFGNDFISKDKIRERIKHNEEQRNNVVSVAKFKIDNDGITGEGIEGLNDLIVYKSYEAVINELNYLLKE